MKKNLEGFLEQKESKIEEKQQQVDAKESSVQTLIMKREQELRTHLRSHSRRSY